MWFKNLVVYRLPANWSITAADLEEQLARRPLQPCVGYELQTRGWVFPSTTERYLHTLHQHHLLAMGVNQKLLPASIINQITKERAQALANEQGFPVGRRQMRELKERVTDELRAKALTRRRVMRAWLDLEHRWFIVDSSSVSKAEELLETLRDTLGSFPAQQLETERSAAMSMGTWLISGNAPGRFNIEQDLELQSLDDTKSVVRYARHPLEGRDIKDHLKSGKTTVRLGLSWNARISFVLNAELQIKRVQFLDIAKDQADEQSAGADEQFDIDFALMSGELRQLLKELTDVLGGEARGENPGTTPDQQRSAA